MRFFSFLLAAAWAAMVSADVITIMQDRETALYATGEEAVFSVSVTDDAGKLRTDGSARWTLDNFGSAKVGEGTADLGAGNPFPVRGTLNEPGFLRLRVNAGTNAAVWSVGYDVEKIRQAWPRPADFDAYWRGEQARLAREVPLEPICTLDERLSKDRPWETFRISFATFNGRRVHGFMTVPRERAKAPFRARVRVCDAGSGAVGPWEGNAAEVTVTMNVHYFEPCATSAEQMARIKAVCDEESKRFGLKPGTYYACAGIASSREDYYFHDAILGIDRMVDWVAERPFVDAKRIVYFGSSQGGGFGLYLNYLNKRFSRACFSVPAMTGHFGRRQNRDDGWPSLLRNQRPETLPDAERNAAYYDGVNFAAGIRHPVRFIVGFSDTTCPPPDVYSAFNACPSSDKAIMNAVGAGHCGWGEWIRKSREKPTWFDPDAWLRAESEFTAEAYRNPPPECSVGFFWMWNAELKPEVLFAQLDEMKANGLDNVCIHPFPAEFRPGYFRSSMSPKYLSPEYVEVYGKVVEHAKKLGMHSWLYDEGGWPSGGAAGLVAASDTEGRFRPQCIGTGRDGNEPLHVWKESYGPGRASYPSMIEKGATERFLKITHERLKARIGGEFGETVKFAFMDEPEVTHPYWWPILPWAEDFAEVFKVRKGYDILPHMQEIIDARYQSSGPAVEMRLDYKDVLGDLFVERFMLPIRNWCRANGLRSGGHFGGEDEPESGPRHGYVNLFKDLRALDVPGVDVIWRQLWPARNAGAGRQVPFPRYAASASRYNGGQYVLSESCGIYGDSLTPTELKWLCDYQMVRGCNTFVFGYQAVSNDGQWMTLFEPHLGPMSPLWAFSRPFFEYMKRTCGLLAKGRSAAEIVVYYDQRSFWAGGTVASRAKDLQYAVAALLDKMHCDFDFADDEVFENSKFEDGVLHCGQARYSTVVVPAWGKMTKAARAKVEAFAAAGGRVLTASDVDLAPQTCGVKGLFEEDIRVAKRVSGDRTLYFLVNEMEHPTEDLEITFAEKGPVVWCDPENGKFVAVDAKDGAFTWRFDPAGSAIFIVGAEAEQPVRPARKYDRKNAVKLEDGWTLRPLTQHLAGKDGLEIRPRTDKPIPVKLGDWRPVLGYDFSGTAVYRTTFMSKGGAARLDLGAVRWASSVTLNGHPLTAKSVRPFRWDVMLEKGENVLEVTVANTLANALSSDSVRDRVARDFPPRSGYDIRQSVYDRENNESGLFGPVTLGFQEDANSGLRL